MVVTSAVVLAGSVLASTPNLSFGWSDDLLVLSSRFEAEAGVATLLESPGPDLPSSEWTPLASFPIGAGTPATLVTTDVLSRSRRFFRLQVGAIEIPAHMVWIPGGVFRMGSLTNDLLSHPREWPQHEVRIPAGFWMDRYEVSQAQYEAVMGWNPSTYQGGRHCPVETVSWEMAMLYCARLTEGERQKGHVPPGCVYRLPTEEEWEYACRAGTMTLWSFGDNSEDLSLYSWWGYGDAEGHPHPVGTKRPNPWGLYDMHGNVFEYCLDRLAPFPGGPPMVSMKSRVARGGSFYCPDYVLRSADRSHAQLPDTLSDLHGFRVVLGSSQPLEGQALPPIAAFQLAPAQPLDSLHLPLGWR